MAPFGEPFAFRGLSFAARGAYCYNEFVIIKDGLKREAIETPFSKAAVDIKRRAVSVGGEFHVDNMEELVQDGSLPKDVWGINIYPDGHIDFISLINVRPAQGNKTMDITDENTRNMIKEIVAALVVD